MDEVTAGIFLGAAEYPRHGSFSNMAFRQSKTAFDDYLRKDRPRGLGLTSSTVLDLFDSPLHPGAQLLAIGDFVDRVKAQHPDATRNLFIYYVGHGYFSGEGREYYLALASYDLEVRDTTGMRVMSLGNTLRSRSQSFRTFYILDCCFAGEALRSLQGDSDSVARLAAAELQIAGRQGQSDAPKRGSALLCATSKDDVALAPDDKAPTIFSDALLSVLAKGDAERGAALTLVEVKELVWNRIKSKHRDKPDYQVRPVVHAPDQREGDISTFVPLFPNPAYRRPKNREESAALVADADRTSSYDHSSYGRIVAGQPDNEPKGSVRKGQMPGRRSRPVRSRDDDFEVLIDKLSKQLWADGVFTSNCDSAHMGAVAASDELATETYLLRLFIQELLFVASKMHECTTRTANAWVCHKTLNQDGRQKPSFLRSAEREGHFDIDQLVTKHLDAVYYRANAVIYDPAKIDTLSVAARAVVEGQPRFQQVTRAKYDSNAEQKIGITHILGIPLYRPEEIQDDMYGVPTVMTIDFKFDREPTPQQRQDIDSACDALIGLFERFKSLWQGAKSLQPRVAASPAFGAAQPSISRSD